MKIRVEITIDDLVAFNRYHHDPSPATRRSAASVRLISSLAIFSIWAVCAVVMESPEYLMFGGVVAIGLYLWLPRRRRKAVER